MGELVMVNREDIILAKNGHEESIEKIIREYKSVILQNKRLFFLRGGSTDDLMQEGFIGLIKAIKCYDENKNTCFSTFANLCIRRQILTAIKSYNSHKYKNLNSAIQGNYSSIIDESVEYYSPSFNFSSPEDICLGKELVLSLTIFLKGSLSSMEKEVFSYLCKEYSYIEIAKYMGTEPKKIDNAIQRIKKKVRTYLSLNF